MRSCSLSQLAVHEELALTKLKDAIALGGEFDDKLRQEANGHQVKLEQGTRQIHANGRTSKSGVSSKDRIIERVIVAWQLVTQLTSLVPEAELLRRQPHLVEQKKQRLAELLVELQAAALVCVKDRLPQDGGSRSQLLARMQALGEWAVPGSRMQLFGSTACDLHTHDSGIAPRVLPCRAHCGPS